MLFKGWGIYVSCFQLQSDPGIESIWKNAASMGHWKPFWHWATWLSSLGSLFGAGWTETSTAGFTASRAFMSFHVAPCIFTPERMHCGKGFFINSTIFPTNLGNIFRSCMGLSLSSALFTPYFHHLKPPNRRLEHFHPILSGVHHLSSPQGRKSTWMYCTVFVYVNICKYTCNYMYIF